MGRSSGRALSTEKRGGGREALGGERGLWWGEARGAFEHRHEGGREALGGATVTTHAPFASPLRPQGEAGAPPGGANQSGDQVASASASPPLCVGF